MSALSEMPVVTVEQLVRFREAAIAVENERANLVERVAELEKQLAIAQLGIFDVVDLIDSSDGVDGLHQNGDIARWSELRGDGQYSEWLCHFDHAVEHLPADQNALIQIVFPDLLGDIAEAGHADHH